MKRLLAPDITEKHYIRFIPCDVLLHIFDCLDICSIWNFMSYLLTIYGVHLNDIRIQYPDPCLLDYHDHLVIFSAYIKTKYPVLFESIQKLKEEAVYDSRYITKTPDVVFERMLKILNNTLYELSIFIEKGVCDCCVKYVSYVFKCSAKLCFSCNGKLSGNINNTVIYKNLSLKPKLYENGFFWVKENLIIQLCVDNSSSSSSSIFKSKIDMVNQLAQLKIFPKSILMNEYTDASKKLYLLRDIKPYIKDKYIKLFCWNEKINK